MAGTGYSPRPTQSVCWDWAATWGSMQIGPLPRWRNTGGTGQLVGSLSHPALRDFECQAGLVRPAPPPCSQLCSFAALQLSLHRRFAHLHLHLHLHPEPRRECTPLDHAWSWPSPLHRRNTTGAIFIRRPRNTTSRACYVLTDRVIRPRCCRPRAQSRINRPGWACGFSRTRSWTMSLVCRPATAFTDQLSPKRTSGEPEGGGEALSLQHEPSRLTGAHRRHHTILR